MNSRQTASDLISKFGKLITLSKHSASAYDPVTGELSASSVSDLSVKVLVKDYKPNEFSGGAIQTGDKKLTLAALNLDTPNVSDTVTIDAVIYSVLSVRTIWAGELAVMFELQVRL